MKGGTTYSDFQIVSPVVKLVDKNIRYKLSTWLRLGLANILVVALYRLAKRLGYYCYRFPVGTSLNGPFLSDDVAEVGGCLSLSYFSYHNIEVSSPPDWFVNPWNGARSAGAGCHWSDISDFMPDLGDIKTVWELSRFDWLPRMAWTYRGGDDTVLAQLELWLRDWSLRNPANSGINWKCGQEASLRCLNLLTAALMVDHCFTEPKSGFLRFLEIHLQRIAPTLRYAMSQDNNHGISEAAALFVVGHYLVLHGNSRQQKSGKRWARQGRYWLENRVCKLILADGSFSQHSVTYHRLMLDVLSFVELVRRRLKIAKFSNAFYRRAQSAVTWLHRIIDTESGDAPNLGSNDGAYLFNLDGADYRDFRPSQQLGAAVFLKRSVGENQIDHPLLELFDLDISKFSPLTEAESAIMIEGGYACLRSAGNFAMLRLPVYRFRPGHADALHLDLWYEGVNWVRDAGTYSYNADAESLQYFPGTVSHSTVSFDRRDQMPRLGRFLFGAWLKADKIEWRSDDGFVRSGYTDYLGASHVREVSFHRDSCCVIDKFTGFKNEALIRWHLADANWKLNGRALSCEKLKLVVESDNNLMLSLVKLPESYYYLEQHSMPVLEIKCLTGGTIKTTFIFND